MPNNVYDEYLTKTTRAIVDAEMNQSNPETAISQLLTQTILDRLSDTAGKTSISQIIGCDVLKAESKGNDYVAWFMDPTRMDYQNYPVEASRLIEIFDHTELVAFFMQVLNLARYRKSEELKQGNTWGNHLNRL